MNFYSDAAYNSQLFYPSTGDSEIDAMTDIYTDFYKPMRNRLAKINLESALASIWSYSMFVDSGLKLPTQLASPDPFLREKLHQWQLAELAREAIMHCARVGGAPFTFKIFASSLDSIQTITDRLSADPLEADPDSIFQFLDAICSFA
jgi:hypothetical protein